MKARSLAATLVAAAALLCMGAAQRETPLARVNGKAVTRDDLRQFMRLNMMADAGRPAAPEQLAAWEEMEKQRKAQALQALVDRRLLVDAAREAYLTGEEAEATVREYAAQELRKFEDRVGSRLQARQMLLEMGLTAEEFKQMQGENLLVSRLLMDKVYDKIQVTPDEMRQYYRENREEFRHPHRLRYRQILFTVVDEDRIPAVRRRAEEVRARIREGADFSEMADEYSDDAERYPGGLHTVTIPEGHPGWRPPAVEGLQPGETSRVRRVPGGLAIVRLESVEPARDLSFEEAQRQVRQQLMARKQEAARERYLRELRESGGVEYTAAAAQELGME
jgi:parvulin-like peptidyl-prolyl isomerase